MKQTTNKATMKKLLLIAGLLLPFLGAAQTYSIDWHKIAGGGGTSTSGQYTVSGTIGQHDASGALTNGPVTGTNYYSVTGGFWVLPQAVQVAGAPVLSIVPAAPGYATISWTPAVDGFVLQENLNLATTNWVNSSSAATNPATVPAGGPVKFYRLNKP